MGTKLYAAPELKRALTPFVVLPTSEALAIDIFSLGQVRAKGLTPRVGGCAHIGIFGDSVGLYCGLPLELRPLP